MEDFKFSDNLREQVEEAVILRITNAFQSGNDVCEDIIRHGHPGIEDMSCNELMDHYMNWHGAYSLEECPDDEILRKMFNEISAYNFEKEVLLKERA
jgi:hypothetical protein